ncbi:histone lysine methyltransferase Set9 [Conoideocrella luteorostrata]|uniref:Histone lysine methyltransferase Set9 n=1 Tax=Conoideocrella luteorostrata TaxID=1105319 RepID=A0AAJ0FX38_9HYPO|nr:histone lysine methyltransferase Set9 [Conoideocrella luteorostrata]
MGLKQFLLLGGVPVALGAACGMDYTKNGLVWGDAIRMNQIQVVGTHNSYHMEAPEQEKVLMQKLSPDVKDLFYNHDKLDVQLKEQHVRNLELDILADPEGGHYAKPLISKLGGFPYPDDPAYNQSGTKVMHIPDLDIHTVCTTFVSCLKIIKTWMDANPKAVPIPIMTEFKEADPLSAVLGGAKAIPWDDSKLLDGIDQEIRSVFDAKQLITPDDIRRPGLTLEESVLKFGWPNLDSARGRIFFLMDNGKDDKVNKKYIEGKTNLEGRVLFTNSAPGSAECAFQKLNDPVTDTYVANIQKQVKAGYWVRTMADTALGTVRNCTTFQRDGAFKSGAQIVSSDFPVSGVSERYGGCKYVVEIGDGKVARCNPVNGREGCADKELE